jgi:hypothetical protein
MRERRGGTKEQLIDIISEKVGGLRQSPLCLHLWRLHTNSCDYEPAKAVCMHYPLHRQTLSFNSQSLTVAAETSSQLYTTVVEELCNQKRHG